MKKSLLTHIGEALDQYHAEKVRASDQSPATSTNAGVHTHSPSSFRRILRWFLPNGGTLILIALLIATQSVWARANQQNGASTNTISYQGRLADSSGTPLTGFHNLEFRIYNVASGGVPLWEELWTGGNAVQISDGLFNVMLGSLDPSLATAIVDQNELYLGITVDTDNEMMPRVQLGSVPFSMQALTVPDNSITTTKFADNSVTTGKIQNGAVTQDKLASDIQFGKLIQNGIVSSGTSTGNFRAVSVLFDEPFQGTPSIVITSDDLPGIYEKTFINVLSASPTRFVIRWYKRDGSDFASSDPSVNAHWIAVAP